MSDAEKQEIKSNLIAWVVQLSDSRMLSKLNIIRLSNSEGDWWDDLTEAQKQQINEGIDDEENDRVISPEELWRALKNS